MIISWKSFDSCLFWSLGTFLSNSKIKDVFFLFDPGLLFTKTSKKNSNWMLTHLCILTIILFMLFIFKFDLKSRCLNNSNHLYDARASLGVDCIQNGDSWQANMLLKYIIWTTVRKFELNSATVNSHPVQFYCTARYFK